VARYSVAAVGAMANHFIIHFLRNNHSKNADDLQYRARQERPQQLQDQGLWAED
jgi:hypothetical protein